MNFDFDFDFDLFDFDFFENVASIQGTQKTKENKETNKQTYSCNTRWVNTLGLHM